MNAEQKKANQRFSALMNRDEMHVRCEDRGRVTFVSSLGSAWDLHGPHGKCVCCPKAAK